MVKLQLKKQIKTFAFQMLAFLMAVGLMFSVAHTAFTALATIVSPKAVLLTLQYDGFDIAGFTSGEFKGTSSTGGVYRDTVTYKVTLSTGTSEAPVVTATAPEDATVNIEQADEPNGTATVTVTESETTNYYKIVFTVNTLPSDPYVVMDYSDGNAGTYDASAGSSKLQATVENGELKLVANAPQWVTQTDGPSYSANDAILRARVRFDVDNPRFGVHLRGKDNTHLIGFHLNNIGTNWAGYNGGEGWSGNAANIPIKKNIYYNIAFQIKGEIGTFWLDGAKLASANIKEALNSAATYYPGGTDETYHFGFRAWWGLQTIWLDDVSISPVEDDVPAPETSLNRENPLPAEGTFETIGTDKLKVLVGSDFPLVYRYTAADDTFLANGTHPWDAPFLRKMVVNNKNVEVQASQLAKGNDFVTYALSANNGTDINFTMTAAISVRENKLRLEFYDIVEKGDTIIKTFNLYDNTLVSLMGNTVQGAFATLNGWGPMQDIFVDLDASASSRTRNVAYALINDDKTAIGVYSSAHDALAKYAVTETVSDTIIDGKVEKTLGIANTAFSWHYYNKSVPMVAGYVPYTEIILGGEQNDFDADGNLEDTAAIDWQDAGLLYRDIAKVPFGGENVKDYYSYIVFNMSSGATNPSVRILDRAKTYSYITDGFGQKVMNKGYQVGGHDDSHGDYKNVSVQQGGAKDFEYLSKVGKNYNIKTGVHMNATEFALDGFETELENMRGYPGAVQPNWNWIDQAYLVDKTKDIVNGDLERRIQDFKTTLPNLDFAYVDVYQNGSDYMAKQLAYYLNKNGITVTTEAASDFEEDTTFFHWNNDPYYSVGGSQSSVIRFVQNDIADKWAPDRAILSALMPSPGGWRGVEKYNEAEQLFYRNNLPTKYLQYHELQKWTPDESAKFSDGVKTLVTETNIGTAEVPVIQRILDITKNGKLVAKIDVTQLDAHATYANGVHPKKTTSSEIFIPWSPETEEKVYYYNDNAAESTWDIPESWTDVTTAHQYKLTETGREYIGTVTVDAGKLTITGDISTPYLITKVMQATGGLGEKRLPEAAGTWGEGSPIANFGFSGDLEGWTKTGTASITTIPTYGSGAGYADPRDPLDYGDKLLSFGAEGGSITQTVSLTPGKTHTLSVWESTQNRNATFEVEVAGKKYVKSIYNNEVQVVVVPNKFWKMKFENLDLDVTMPTGVSTAKITYTVEAGAGASYVDDFRTWEWQTEPDRRVKDNEAVYEDFENVDDGWGAFVSGINGEPGIHLAQKNIAAPSTQIKNYVIDGEWSLRDQQTNISMHMRTVPSTLSFDTRYTYQVSFDYMTYIETRSGAQAGFSMPLSADIYRAEVRSKDGTIISQQVMKKSTFASTNYSYDSRPSVEKMVLQIPKPTEGMYVSISKTATNDASVLVVDNLRAVRTDGATMSNMTADNGSATVTLGGNIDWDSVDKSMFTGKISVNGVNLPALSITDIEINEAAKKVKVLFPKIVESPVAQQVSIELTLNGAVSTSKSFVLAPTSAYYAKPGNVSVAFGAAHGLPGTLNVRLANAHTANLPVTYTGYNSNQSGVQTVTGTIDTTGNIMPFDFVAAFTVQVTVAPQKPYYTPPADITLTQGDELTLVKTLEVKLADGTTAVLNVTYTGYDKDTVGVQTVTGTIDTAGKVMPSDFEASFTVSVTVKAPAKGGCGKTGGSLLPLIFIPLGAVLFIKKKH